MCSAFSIASLTSLHSWVYCVVCAGFNSVLCAAADVSIPTTEKRRSCMLWILSKKNCTSLLLEIIHYFMPMLQLLTLWTWYCDSDVTMSADSCWGLVMFSEWSWQFTFCTVSHLNLGECNGCHCNLGISIIGVQKYCLSYKALVQVRYLLMHKFTHLYAPR